MIWSGRGDKLFHIPEFEENNELIHCIETVCSLRSGGFIGEYDINKTHWVHVSIYIIHDWKKKREAWRTLNICHMEDMIYIDEINAVKTPGKNIKLSYSRNMFPIPECKDLWFLDSRKIDWNKFVKWLKMRCIEKL